MTGRILIVDDLSINVKLLEAKLSAEYFQVLTASNGQAALEIAAAELPDVVLLDVMMPHMDGFEVCRRLKTEPRTADLPVVMVTALSDTAYRLHGLEVGADDFLTKPVSDIALFARVRSLVRLRRLIQEWRLRDEICGHFGGGPPAGRGPNRQPTRHPQSDGRGQLRGGAGAAGPRYRSCHRQPHPRRSRRATLCFLLPCQRSAAADADPLDRRGARSAPSGQRPRSRRE